MITIPIFFRTFLKTRSTLPVLLILLTVMLLLLVSSNCAASPTVCITTISAGSNHVLILLSNGTVWAWGGGAAACGQKSENEFFTSPVMVTGLSNVTAISAGEGFSLALKDDGTVWSWGNNYLGQLGRSLPWQNAEADRIAEPMLIPSLSNVIDIKVSDQGYALALKDDGTVWAWGSNSFGQLGAGVSYSGHEGYVSYPVKIKDLYDVKAIAVGTSNVFALKNDGTVWAWGNNGTLLGVDGRFCTEPVRTTPILFSGLTNVSSLAIGASHALALKDDGTVWSWGDDWRGKLGVGSSKYNTPDCFITSEPVQVLGLNNIVAIDVSNDHSVALGSDGRVWAWGSNEIGQIGDGTTEDRNVPVLVPVDDVSLISGSFMVDRSGNIYGCGSNGGSQLGILRKSSIDYRSTPVKIDFCAALATPAQPTATTVVMTPSETALPIVSEITQPSPSRLVKDNGTVTGSSLLSGNNTFLIGAIVLITLIGLGLLGYLIIKK